jgi:hypothetical protein
MERTIWENLDRVQTERDSIKESKLTSGAILTRFGGVVIVYMKLDPASIISVV